MNKTFRPQLGQIILSQETIQNRVKELAEQITKDYQGQELHLLAVLRGAVPFLADLCRNIKLDVTFDFLAVSRSGQDGQVRLLKDLDTPLENRQVLLVEDIVNEGETISFLSKTLALRHPANVRICTIFDRPNKRKKPVELDYIGFELDDKYVVGYGLDFEQQYRNLPYLAELKFSL